MRGAKSSTRGAQGSYGPERTSPTSRPVTTREGGPVCSSLLCGGEEARPSSLIRESCPPHQLHTCCAFLGGSLQDASVRDQECQSCQYPFQDSEALQSSSSSQTFAPRCWRSSSSAGRSGAWGEGGEPEGRPRLWPGTPEEAGCWRVLGEWGLERPLHVLPRAEPPSRRLALRDRLPGVRSAAQGGVLSLLTAATLSP